MKYDPSKIEQKWQTYWDKQEIYKANSESKKQKKYVLVEFPYPSGEGLHMGHLRPYTAADTYARFHRMKGYEVLFPMGWDAFGLPAENFAIKNKVHPSVSTAKNIVNAKKQLKSWGTSFDWSREVNTTDPGYYKWTQWIFLQLFKAGLAYEATGLINWCPKDKTGLANEEVIDGKCERCGTVVEKKELRQWYLKITAYAEKLLAGLKELPEWPEPVKLQQENWIGKSEGASIKFAIRNLPVRQAGSQFTIEVFTTRPDTLFGATYVVLAPEHPLVTNNELQITNYKEVTEYVEKTKKETDIQRTSLDKEKTGVELKGVKAINPATKEEIPVWIADYVLASYGTGAIMAVPAHDERDFEFAQKFSLLIRKVILPPAVDKIIQNVENVAAGAPTEIRIVSDCYLGEGELINSGKFNGMDSEKAKWEITKLVGGEKKTQYKLRDWVFSRQRYWGEPIPLVFCENCAVKIKSQKTCPESVEGSNLKNKEKDFNFSVRDGKEYAIIPVPENELPLKLPEVADYEPTGTGESPLAVINDWVNTKCPKCGAEGAKRETNTMPQWAGSSWYWLRYTDPKNDKEFASKELLKHWTPADVYFGGMEHTTLHLLYSRFWNLFLYDQGHVTAKEPYTKRVPHGIVLAADGDKMSKSKDNVVNPDDIMKQYGADTMRMYELFLGPHGAAVTWNDKGIVGVKRFLDKVYAFKFDESAPANKNIHKLVKKISEDMAGFKFNTAVSSFMEFLNENKILNKEDWGMFLKLLAPFAPHISEELWVEVLGNKTSIHVQPWPEYDTGLIKDETVRIVIQVNGKVRDMIEVKSGLSEEEIKPLVMAQEKVNKYIGGHKIKKFIYIQDKLTNIVI